MHTARRVFYTKFFMRSSAIMAALLFATTPMAFAYAAVSVSVGSVSPNTTVSVGTAVSFNVSATGFTNPTYAISDSFSGSSVTNSDMSSSGAFSWTPGNADIGTHNFTITVSDSLGDTATTQESITVTAQPSISIGSVSPGNTISTGTNLTFTANASGFTDPVYSVSDSLNGSSVTNADINSSSGVFSWTPASNQPGTHVITVYANDSLGHSASASVSVTVTQPATVVIESLSPGASVNSGQNVSFTAESSGFTSPSYTVSDSFSGSSVSSNDINSSGVFSWTPTSNDVGTHTITVTTTDSSGHVATATQTITVTSSGEVSGTGGATIQGFTSGSTVIVGQPVTFTVAASGFSNPAFTVQDSFSGSSVSSSDVNSAGYFSWTPIVNDAGTHNITFYVNDSSGHTGNVTVPITVAEPSITITSLSPGTDVLPNSTMTFDVTAAGFTNPSYTLSDSFSGTSITNSDINSSGQFSWTPATSQNGTHTITVYATDSEGHSANTSITVDVNSGVSVTLSAPSPNSSVSSGTALTFQAYPYGFTDPTYTLQDSFPGTSLTNAEINSSGDFYWIPSASDAGQHLITVTATDAYGHVGSAQVTITVVAGAAQSGTGSSGSGTITFTEELYPGLTDQEVSDLQATLTSLGFYSGPITGYYGPLTETAVDKFQAAHGLEQVGEVGPQTRAELNALLSGTASSSATTSTSSGATVGDGYVFSDFLGAGDTGKGVTELQERLAAFGVYTGPVTGYFGTLTKAAVEKFQTQHGIEAVGYVGPATRAALNQ